MNNSVFSIGIYRDSLRRLRMPAIFALVIVGIQSIFVPLCWFLSQMGGKSHEQNISFWVAQSALFILPFFVLVLENILFGFLNHRNASDFWHSIPIKRSALYISFIVAVITWIAVIMGTSMLLTLVSYSLVPKVTIDFKDSYTVFAGIVVFMIFVLAVELLAKNIAGTKLSILCTECFIIFFPRGIITFIKLMTTFACDYVVMDETCLLWGNKYNIVWRYMELYDFDDYTLNIHATYIYTLVLSLIYIIIAGVLFVKRKSEKAEDVAVSPLVQRILSFVPPIVFGFLPCGMTIAYIFDREGFETNGMAGIIAIFFVIAVIVYLLYELITVRKWASVKKAAKYIWVLFAVYAVIIGGIVLNINIIKSHRPSAQDIDYINVLEYENSLQDDFVHALSNIRLEDEEVKRIVADTLSKRIDESTFANMGIYNNLKVRIVYNGKTIVRKLHVSTPEFMEHVMQNEEVSKIYYEKVPFFEGLERIRVSQGQPGDPEVNYDISKNRVEFAAALKADKLNMTAEEWVDCTSDSINTLDGRLYYSIYIHYSFGGSDSGFISIHVTEKNKALFKNVCSFLEDKTRIIVD